MSLLGPVKYPALVRVKTGKAADQSEDCTQQAPLNGGSCIPLPGGRGDGLRPHYLWLYLRQAPSPGLERAF